MPVADAARVPGPRQLAELPRTGRVAAVDAWLTRLLDTATGGSADGIALVAVGSLGRRELPPYGDLDLVLVHDGRPGVGAIADAVWYPIWDAGFRLDHSVRTVRETVAVAGSDVRAGLGLLDARHVAGDRRPAAELRTAALAAWRSSAARLLPQLKEMRRKRAALAGELAFLIEPDLKEAYGGLREGQVLRAVAAAQLADAPPDDAERAYSFLLDVRDALRRDTGRPGDVLVRQEHRPVAAALGLPGEDALLREVSLAGRRLAFVADRTWRRVDAALSRPRRLRPVRREPLADGIVRHGDEVVLARDAHPATDPGLLVRGAAAAARAQLLLSPYTLTVLAAHTPPLPEPWPAEVRWSFLRLLAAGRAAVPVLEQLDQEGLLSRLLPEWDRVRSLPQRHPWHRFTVDRHLIETAAEAAALTRDVDRPDLLLAGALCHDIGKGWPGDHSVAGEPVTRRIARRMGFPEADVGTLGALTRHHLLLPDTATRRDPDDPATIERVAATLGHDLGLLRLLHALAQADARATGPSAWTPWRAHLIAALVGRVEAHLGSGPAVEPEPLLEPTEERVSAPAPDFPGAPAGRVTVGIAEVADGQQVTIGAPDRPGLFGICAGVLALHQLDVRAAKTATENGMATAVFAVRPRFGRAPVPEILADAVRAALDGTLRLDDRLRQRESDYRQNAAQGAPPRISWHDAEVSGVDTGIVEVRASDSAGLLHRLAAALTAAGLDVTDARIETFGADAVDTFYVRTPTGEPMAAAERARVEAALAAAATGG